MAKPSGALNECQDCKYCNLDGEYGPECEYGPPEDITWMHPHQWPLVNIHHKPCGVAVSAHK
jgi:hypothetical protein